MAKTFVPVAELMASRQLSLAFATSSATTPVAVTPEVSEMLAASCVVAIGVSGGKDSQACAIQTSRYLDEIGHTARAFSFMPILARLSGKTAFQRASVSLHILDWI